MVGEFGETQIVDWGLARVQSDALPDPSSPSSDRSLSDLPTRVDATVAGALLGTPDT